MKLVSHRISVGINPHVADAVFGRYAVVIQPVALDGAAGEISRSGAEGVAVVTLRVRNHLYCCVRGRLVGCLSVVFVVVMAVVAGMALTTLLLLFLLLLLIF